MTIKEAQEAVDQWIKEYGVRYFSELTNMACLTEEVGELARVIARTYGDQSWAAWYTPTPPMLPLGLRQAWTSLTSAQLTPTTSTIASLALMQ